MVRFVIVLPARAETHRESPIAMTTRRPGVRRMISQLGPNSDSDSGVNPERLQGGGDSSGRAGVGTAISGAVLLLESLPVLTPDENINTEARRVIQTSK